MFNFENFSAAQSLMGLLPFGAYFAVAVSMMAVFVVVYAAATPYNELKLIKENNVAAAISFGGALMGYTIPMTKAMDMSVNLADFALWALVALVIQIVLFFAIRLPFPKMICRIKDGQVAMAVFMAALSICVGAVNASSMSY